MLGPAPSLRRNSRMANCSLPGQVPLRLRPSLNSRQRLECLGQHLGARSESVLWPIGCFATPGRAPRCACASVASPAAASMCMDSAADVGIRLVRSKTASALGDKPAAACASVSFEPEPGMQEQRTEPFLVRARAIQGSSAARKKGSEWAGMDFGNPGIGKPL